MWLSAEMEQIWDMLKYLHLPFLMKNLKNKSGISAKMDEISSVRGEISAEICELSAEMGEISSEINAKMGEISADMHATTTQREDCFIFCTVYQTNVWGSIGGFK